MLLLFWQMNAAAGGVGRVTVSDSAVCEARGSDSDQL